MDMRQTRIKKGTRSIERIFLIATICASLCIILWENKRRISLVGSNDSIVSQYLDQFSSSTLLQYNKTNVEDKPTPFSFSACLLIKDDNVLLPEWLAYHYTFLPLRRLIVAVDPLSHTTPEPIFEKYRSIGMNITVWTNESTYWWKERAMAEHERLDFVAKNTTTHQILHWRHRYRQKVFYTACLQQLYREGRTWTAFVDTDEYVTFNHYDELNGEGPPTWCSKGNSTCEEEYKTSIRDGSHHRTKLDESTTAAQHIHSHADEAFDNIDKPCLVFARYLFISKDIGPGDYNIQDEVDDEFNTTLFHTLRYRYRTSLREQQVNGKALVDVSRYDGQNVHNPHRVLGDKCSG